MHASLRVFPALIAMLLVACIQKPAPNEHRAEAFELKDSKGASHRFEDEKGKTVIVHFWASWCPPCVGEMSDVVQAARDNPRIRFVMVSLDKSWADAEKLLSSNGLPTNMISLLDPGQKVASTWGSYQFPETYVVSGEQKILMKWIGPQAWDSPEMKKVLGGI